LLVTSAALEVGREFKSNFVPETGDQSGIGSSNMGNIRCGHGTRREGFELHLYQRSELNSQPKSQLSDRRTLNHCPNVTMIWRVTAYIQQSSRNSKQP